MKKPSPNRRRSRPTTNKKTQSRLQLLRQDPSIGSTRLVRTGKSVSSWFSGDRRFLVLFAVVDILLIVAAHRHFTSFQRITHDPFLLRPSEVQKMDLNRFSSLSQSGSWKEFEVFRNDRLKYYLSSNVRPSVSAALYFFPELLASDSFEHHFAQKKLIPVLEILKSSYEQNNFDQALKTYQLLKIRVVNFESAGDESRLTHEARKFLDVYSRLTLKRHS